MKILSKITPMALLLVLVFYYIYPIALDVAGSSFVFLAGILGLGLYVYHRFPFKEVVYAIAAMLLMYFVFFTASWVNKTQDLHFMNNFKSQIAYFFSAYLVIFFVFKVHKQPTFNTLILYIGLAVTLQAVITFAMYLNEGIKDFFYSLQMQVLYTEEIVSRSEDERLVGYGIGFFGAGAYSGMGLMAISYILMRMRLNFKQFMTLALLYVFTFYIGLFMARTTVIGMVFSLIIIAILYFLDHRSSKKQGNILFFSLIFLLAGGYTFSMFYFPAFSDWAFELFNNFINTGKLETRSSNGLEEMFLIPDDLHTLLFGKGSMAFWGSDVGYSRLLFYAGVPGTLAFFMYSMFIIKCSFTKDWAVNIFPISILIYVMALNVKGAMEMNFVLYLIFFFFLFYKYYIFNPKIYLRNKQFLSDKRYW